ELLAATRSGHPLTSMVAPILTARLGALSPDARTAAGAVAAAVGPVPHRILAEVSGLPEPALLAGLRECVDHHVLVADGRAGTYAFRHSLLREAAEAGLLPGEAHRLHAAYGRALSAALGTAALGAAGPAAADRRGGGPSAAGPEGAAARAAGRRGRTRTGAPHRAKPAVRNAGRGCRSGRTRTGAPHRARTAVRNAGRGCRSGRTRTGAPHRARTAVRNAG